MTAPLDLARLRLIIEAARPGNGKFSAPTKLLVSAEERALIAALSPDVVKALLDRVAALEAALRAIAPGAGTFSRDPLEHATNCVLEMREIARAALGDRP